MGGGKDLRFLSGVRGLRFFGLEFRIVVYWCTFDVFEVQSQRGIQFTLLSRVDRPDDTFTVVYYLPLTKRLLRAPRVETTMYS